MLAHLLPQLDLPVQIPLHLINHQLRYALLAYHVRPSLIKFRQLAGLLAVTLLGFPPGLIMIGVCLGGIKETWKLILGLLFFTCSLFWVGWDEHSCYGLLGSNSLHFRLRELETLLVWQLQLLLIQQTSQSNLSLLR